MKRVIGRCIVNGDNFEGIVSFLAKDAAQTISQETAVIVAWNDETYLNGHRQNQLRLDTRAGTPMAVTFAGMSRTTTAPAPTTLHAPIDTHSFTTTPAPIYAPSPIVTAP